MTTHSLGVIIAQISEWVKLLLWTPTFTISLIMQVFSIVYGVYIFLYKSSLKFDHYYFITDGSLCLLYSIHSNATITMSMV